MTEITELTKMTKTTEMSEMSEMTDMTEMTGRWSSKLNGWRYSDSYRDLADHYTF